MGIINWLKKDVKIGKPFLFLLACFTSLLIGFTTAYIYKERQLRERIILTQERELVYAKTISEYEKKISDRSKVLEVRYPDGTIKKETIKDISTQESGVSVIDYEKLSERLSISKTNNMPNFELILMTDTQIDLTGSSFSRYIGNLGALFMAYPFSNFGLGAYTKFEFSNEVKPSVGLAVSYRW